MSKIRTSSHGLPKATKIAAFCGAAYLAPILLGAFWSIEAFADTAPVTLDGTSPPIYTVTATTVITSSAGAIPGVYGTAAFAPGSTIVNNGSISQSFFTTSDLASAIYLTNDGNVTNNGSLSSTEGNAIYLNSTGTVVNGTNGTITGDRGIYANGGAATVINDGYIGASVGVNGGPNSAVSVTNTGRIEDGIVGVELHGTGSSLDNSGTISASAYGVLTNSVNGTSTIVNSGSISGTLYAVYLGSAGDTLKLETGSVITGSIMGTSSSLVLEGTGSMANTVSGMASLKMAGAAWTLNGAVSATNTEIQSGALEIGSTGTLTSSNGVLVDSGAVAQGTGMINANVSIQAGGTLLPGTITTPGTLHINGNLAVQSGAVVQIGVNSGAITTGASTDTGYGRATVSGNTVISPSASVSLVSQGYAFAANQRYVVISTAGTATYNESNLNYSAVGATTPMTVSGAAVADQGNTDLVLTLKDATTAQGGGSTPTSPSNPTTGPSSTQVGQYATTPNAIRSLNGLLSYTGISNASLLNLYDATLGALAVGTVASANHIGKQLAPSQNGPGAATPTLGALDVVNAHMNAMHLASNDSESGTGSSGVATGDDPLAWEVWGQGFGGHASQQDTSIVDGYSANYGGMVVGADHAVGERWRLGGVFSMTHTAIDDSGDTSNDTTSVNSYGLLGYASYAGNPWYVNLTGGVVVQHYDTSRLVGMTGFEGFAQGSFGGQQYVARVEGGYPLAVGELTVTPIASLQYSYLNQNSYTESGGNGAALSVDGSHSNSVRSALGVKIEKAFETSYGRFVPEFGAQWIHEYDRARQSTDAHFAADTSGETAFTSVGLAPTSDLADISLGLTLLRANNMSVTARYELQAGGGFVSNTGILRLQQLF
jgi:outer membrane autotransporter protein